jgi:acyl carrier protein
MTKDEIFAEIRAILIKDFECEPEAVTPEARFREDLDFDSIDAVDLIVRLQNRTGIKVKAEDFQSIRTLGDVADVIGKLLAEKGA